MSKPTKLERSVMHLLADDEDVTYAEGFDEAAIGIARGFNGVPVMAYDRAKCIEILSRDMPVEDAEEFFSFNVSGAYVGESTPIFIERIKQ